jgi:WD40 repeat protein
LSSAAIHHLLLLLLPPQTANFLQTTGEEEDFYCCKWTIDSASREPLLLLAGKLGLLRVVNCVTNSTAVTLKGHGKEINDINVHPQHPHLVLTASKVGTMYCWWLLGCMQLVL